MLCARCGEKKRSENGTLVHFPVVIRAHVVSKMMVSCACVY